MYVFDNEFIGDVHGWEMLSVEVHEPTGLTPFKCV